MKIHWERADPPLPPVAVAATGTAADVLSAKAGRDPTWTIARFDDWIVIVGEELPWVDGAIYLAWLPGAPHVLLPVHRRPRLHPELVERATATFRGTAPSAALIPGVPGVEGVEGVTVLPLHP